MTDNLFINSIVGIREEFGELLENENFIIDKTGKKVIEILAAQFLADDTEIFGKLNNEYLEKEIKWYLSQEPNINAMEPPIPALWNCTSGDKGETNSNYGYLVYNFDNHLQFYHVKAELRMNPDSRRAIMIYTRPSIWFDYTKNGMNDFICTNSVQYFIRNNKLIAYVNMRSNDAVFGYKCDYHWQKHVLENLRFELLDTYPLLEIGNIVWNVGSLHIYERHFYLVHRFLDNGRHDGTL
ncbi:MAG: thymidylate synthase [Leuconostoc mesenteroides]